MGRAFEELSGTKTESKCASDPLGGGRTLLGPSGVCVCPPPLVFASEIGFCVNKDVSKQITVTFNAFLAEATKDKGGSSGDAMVMDMLKMQNEAFTAELLKLEAERNFSKEQLDLLGAEFEKNSAEVQELKARLFEVEESNRSFQMKQANIQLGEKYKAEQEKACKASMMTYTRDAQPMNMTTNNGRSFTINDPKGGAAGLLEEFFGHYRVDQLEKKNPEPKDLPFDYFEVLYGPKEKLRLRSAYGSLLDPANHRRLLNNVFLSFGADILRTQIESVHSFKHIYQIPLLDRLISPNYLEGVSANRIDASQQKLSQKLSEAMRKRDAKNAAAFDKNVYRPKNAFNRPFNAQEAIKRQPTRTRLQDQKEMTTFRAADPYGTSADASITEIYDSMGESRPQMSMTIERAEPQTYTFMAVRTPTGGGGGSY